MKVSEICNKLEIIAPSNTCLSFDNVGLLVGDNNKDVNKMLIALDLTKDVLDEAIEQNVDFILTHHPLIFSPMKKVVKNDIIGDILIKLIKNDISYYASHTNLDKSDEGTNMLLANKLNLENSSFIDYDDLICVLGNTDIHIDKFVDDLKNVLNIDYIRIVDSGKKHISKVAIATGSGDSYSLFDTCSKIGADVLVTGDLKYHTMQFAKDIGLTVIDASHFYTENIISNHLKELLDIELNELEIVVSKVHENVFKTI